LAVLFYITREAGTLLWRGATGEGESGVSEEVPPQASSQSRPINNGQGGPDSLKLKVMRFQMGGVRRRTPPRGKKVPRSEKDLEEDAVLVWPGGSCL